MSMFGLGFLAGGLVFAVALSFALVLGAAAKRGDRPMRESD